MSRRCHDLMRQVRSSRVKYVYSALVDIRKNFIKNTKDQHILVTCGFIQRLLELLQTRESLDNDFRVKVTDISISILGNMCMEEASRKQVLKNNGVTIIADLLVEADTESLQNRSCRCLANILLSPGSWELAHGTSVIERTTKLLHDTENDEHKQTYIRAIRLLGQTGSHVQKLVEQNGVSAILKHLDSNTEPVSQSALCCLHSLSIHGCTDQFASQILSSGKVSYLLTLTKTAKTESFQLLVRLCEHHNFRPEFGNIGGITAFVELFNSQEVLYEVLKLDIVNVLCLCCKEAVNRVKLRDEGVLVMLLESLSEERFCNLHTRIISALIWFLYDQPSFDILLENGLVPILIKQLKNYFQSSSEDGKEDLTDVSDRRHGDTEDLLEMGQGDTQDLSENSQTGPKDLSVMRSEGTQDVSEMRSGGTQDVSERRSGGKQDVSEMRSGSTQDVSERRSEGTQDVSERRSEGTQDVSERRSEGTQDISERRSEDTKALSEIRHADTEELSKTREGNKEDQLSEMRQEGQNSLSQTRQDDIDDNLPVIRQDEAIDQSVKSLTSEAAICKARGIDDKGEDDEADTDTTCTYTGEDDVFSEPKKNQDIKHIERSLTFPCSNKTFTNKSHSQEVIMSQKLSTSRPVYSMDSPTYDESFSEWNDEQFSEGAKCIERFIPPPPVDWSGAKSYSPLSNISYYSPSEGSPQYSPRTSQSGYSPGSSLIKNSQNLESTYECSYGYSPELETQSTLQANRLRHRHKYTGVNCRIYRTAQSPGSSPEREGKSLIRELTSKRRCSFSSTDSSSRIDTLSTASFVKTPDSTDEIMHHYQYSPITSPKISEYDTKGVREDKHKVIVAKGSAEKSDIHLSVNRKIIRKRKKMSSKSIVFENNILILLSRVSQMTDPTMHLVTKEVLHCLLDYIDEMEAPLARAARLLSRVFRNPNCFQKLLSLHVPLIIFETLLEKEDLKTLISKRHKKKKHYNTLSPSCGSQGGDYSPDSDRFSMTDESLLEEENPTKRQRRTSNSAETRITQTFKGAIHKQDLNTCTAGNCGIAFLEDLNGIADSQYGCGTLERLLITCDDSQRLYICLSVPFIVWTPASRLYYLSNRGIFDQLVILFTDDRSHLSQQFDTAIKGLGFLANIIDTRSKYQVKNRKYSVHRGGKLKVDEVKMDSDITSRPKLANISTASGNDEEREYKDVIRTEQCSVVLLRSLADTVFLVEGEKIYTNRSKLIAQSEIFAAMLEGHYTEANLSEIPIPETSKFAFEYVIHYLHGCTVEKCDIIQSLYTATVTKVTAQRCIQVLVEADKFLLTTLQEMVSECLFRRYIIPESAMSVVMYSTLHNMESFLPAAISSILVDATSDSARSCLFREFLTSEYAELFIHILSEILMY